MSVMTGTDYNGGWQSELAVEDFLQLDDPRMMAEGESRSFGA